MYQREVSFGEAIQRALQYNYCNFMGRASRSEFWWFSLFSFLCSLVASSFSMGSSTLSSIFGGVVSLFLLLPTLGLAWRRLHDIGKGGGWYFINFIPVVGNILFIIWMCQPSEPRDNRFGPVPNVVYN